MVPVVIVTPTLIVAVCAFAPVTVIVAVPLPIAVSVNDAVPPLVVGDADDGETVATDVLLELAVNGPAKFGCDTVKLPV
jgi:hypothetical protein